MYKSFYEGTALLGFPLFALLFFCVFFCIVVASVFRRLRTSKLEILSRMPLDDGDGSSHVL